MNEFMNIKNKKDCDECVDFKDWLAQQKNSSEKSSKERQKSESKTQMKDQQDQAQVKEQLFTSESYENECPLFRDQLGRVAWTYLHSMAAYYPTKPSEKDKQAMDNFIHSFAHFFPCKECAEDFKEEIVKNPPRLTNNLELSKWFCEQHNVVNRKLGKDEFDCEKVFERWKMGFSKNPKCADIRL